MNLNIYLPFRKFSEYNEVSKIIFETNFGNYGILPDRLDFTAAVAPGILRFEINGTEHWIAIDEGVLIKCNGEVSLSVRNAIEARDLADLHRVVETEFLNLDKNEQSIRTSLAKLEGDYMKRLMDLRHG